MRDATVGIVFLGTPFKGSRAQRLAQWLVAYEGFMGERASVTLIRDLDKSTGVLDDLVDQFTREINQRDYHLPLHCFYETKPTNLLNKVLPKRLAKFTEVNMFVRIPSSWRLTVSANVVSCSWLTESQRIFKHGTLLIWIVFML